MTPYDKWLLYWRGHREDPKSSRSSWKLAHIMEWVPTQPTPHREEVDRFLESCRD